jgi:hypothetical protein
MVDAGAGLYFGGALIPPALGCPASIAPRQRCAQPAPCQKHNASDTFLFDGTFDGTFQIKESEIQYPCGFQALIRFLSSTQRKHGDIATAAHGPCDDVPRAFDSQPLCAATGSLCSAKHTLTPRCRRPSDPARLGRCQGSGPPTGLRWRSRSCLAGDDVGQQLARAAGHGPAQRAVPGVQEQVACGVRPTMGVLSGVMGRRPVQNSARARSPPGKSSLVTISSVARRCGLQRLVEARRARPCRRRGCGCRSASARPCRSRPGPSTPGASASSSIGHGERIALDRVHRQPPGPAAPAAARE